MQPNIMIVVIALGMIGILSKMLMISVEAEQLREEQEQ